MRTVRDANGLDWYEHEDGSMSITQILLRKELGRMEPITNVFNPAPTVELGSEQKGSAKSR
ncbi:MAG: hypothetical protein GY926_16035 [bacterium]|nr:hypothetical protein [bacterium]